MAKHKPTLYLIGGLARTGKTTIARRVMRQRLITAIGTDLVRTALRKVLTGESYIAIHSARFRGEITFHRPGSLKEYRLTIKKEHWDEEEMTWQGMLGVIEAHDRRKRDLLLEGIAITPERVRRLKLNNLRLRVIFMGYGEFHIASILAHSRKKRDWIDTVIKEHGGDDTAVRKGLRRGVVKSMSLKKKCQVLGYKYFDVSERPFQTQIGAATAYLLMH